VSDYLIKLVRDRVDASFAHERHEVVYRPIVDPEGVIRRLRSKLIEEGAEYLTASSRPARVEEAADALEVLRSLAFLDLGLGDDPEAAFESLLEFADKKRLARGGFIEGRGMFAREIPNEEER
jgi:predicted house-cleaning noncanonical NTP pyrophosphatase (MazG superfamily)